MKFTEGMLLDIEIVCWKKGPKQRMFRNFKNYNRNNGRVC